MSGQRVMRDLQTGQLIDAEGNPTDQPQTIDSRVQFGYTFSEDGNRQPQLLSWLELGFIPNFYQFVDTVIEMKLAIRVNKSTRQGGGIIVTSTPVDASYSSSYSYNADLAAVFKTKLVPIPPPAALEERLRDLLEQERFSPSTETPAEEDSQGMPE
jgi:hypothetical protein